MMHVHQASVSSYLEDVILGSLQQTADSEARKEVRHQATLINTLAQHFQHTYATHTHTHTQLQCTAKGKLEPRPL